MKTTIRRRGDDLVAIRGSVKVIFEHIGEGWNGDYNPDDPEDTKLYRFGVEKKVGRKWEYVEDTSYCTQLPLLTSTSVVKKAIVYVLDEMYDAVVFELEHGYRNASPKKIGERLSWISDADFMPPA